MLIQVPLTGRQTQRYGYQTDQALPADDPDVIGKYTFLCTIELPREALDKLEAWFGGGFIRRNEGMGTKIQVVADQCATCRQVYRFRATPRAQGSESLRFWEGCQHHPQMDWPK